MSVLASLLSLSLLSAVPADSLQLAKDLNTPLVQALRERRHEDAERIARRQLALRREYGEARDLALATSLTYLSLATRNLGDVNAAESSAREALEIMLELYGRDNGGSATALNNLAGALRLKGDLVGAEALYRESLLLQTAQFGEDASRLSGPHNNLGALLGQLGDTVGSEEHLRRALELARVHYGEEHSNVALAHVNLANALRGQQRPADALAELDRADGLYQSLGDDTGWAGARLTRVRTLLDLGENESAMREAEALLKFHDSLESSNPLSVARVQALLGQAMLRLDQADASRQQLLLARTALEQRFGPSHPETVNATVDLAAALLELKDPAAMSLLEQLAESYEQARSRLALSRNRATVDLRSPYELLARAYLAAGDEVAAWRASERQRGRVLEELLELSAAALPPQLLRRRSQLLRNLSDLEQELQRFDESPKVDETLRANRYAELLRLQAEWSELQREIASLRPARSVQPTLAEIEKALPANGALIGWIDGAAYCVRPDEGLEWTEVGIAEGAARSLLQDALRAPATAPAFVTPSVDDAMRSQMSALYSAYFQALEPLLGGFDELFVIPAAGLRGIPMEVLMDGEGRLLGERFRFHMLPSASFLLRERSAPRAVESGLFLGNPPFAGGSSRRYSTLTPLTQSSAEIERCSSLFPASQRRVGADASEESIRALIDGGQLRQFDVLHIATHALADARQPGRSTLVLSQESLGDPVEAVLAGRPVLDGAISAEEIARNWKLNAELVTLSACETGLGRHAEGEGYLGFAHSLFEAGAKRLLVSLWPVDDEATAMLMERFYSNWIRRELPPAAALQDAKRWLRTQGNDRFEHPYFWAAFVLLGV